VTSAPIHVRVPYERIGEHLELIRSRRMDLEVYLDAGALDAISPSDILRLREALDYGPSIIVHGPFMDLSAGAVDPRARALAEERFLMAVELAAPLGPRTFVFHSGYEKWRYDHNPEPWLEASLRSWPPVIEAASRVGALVAVENIFEDEPGTLRLLMEELGPPKNQGFGLCFDSGHFNLFSKVSLEDWIEGLAPHIIHLHLHDNDGTRDSHLPVGDGSFDFRGLFSSLSRSGQRPTLTVENQSPEAVLLSIRRIMDYERLSS